MNPLDFILKLIPPTVLLAITGISVVVAGLFIHLYQGEVHAHAQFKADVSSKQMEIQRENEQKQSEAQSTLLAISDSWKRAYNYSRAHPVVRVLPANCNQGIGTEVTGTGTKPDETSGTGLPSTTVDASRCEELINYGIRDAAQVLHLQADRAALCKVYGCE